MLDKLTTLTARLRSPIAPLMLRSALLHRGWPALAVLAWAYRRTLLRRTHLVAVVGSYGKTTTWRAVRAALDLPAEAPSHWTYRGRLAFGLLRIPPTARHAAVEVAIDRPGQMATFAKLVRPDVAIVTSIGSEHNRSLRTLERTREEKAAMVRALSADGLAVLNGDDPNVRWMASQTQARVVTFGLGADNDIRATDVRLDWPNGTCFTVHVGEQQQSVKSQLIGAHQVGSMLAAVAVGLDEGLALDSLLARLEAVKPTEGRLQPVALANGAWILRDDVKSSLETIDAALEVLSEIPARRRLVLLGDISEPPAGQRQIYRRLGARLAGIADLVVAVGAAGRQYASGFHQAGGAAASLVDVGRNYRAAAEVIAQQLGAGDVVLIKGRDRQRLERAAFLIAGRPVRCELSDCWISAVSRCGGCRMLERGWGDQPDPLAVWR